MGSPAGAVAEPLDIEPVEPAEPSEPAASSEPAEPAEPGGEPAAADSKLPLYKQVEPTLKALQQEGKLDARTVRKVAQALIRDGKISQALPEGFEKAAGVIREVQTLAYPGQEGAPLDQVLPAVKAELQGWRDFDVKISNGDGAVVDELIAAAPEGFQNLVPVAFAKYRDVNPDGYSKMVAEAVVGDLNASEVPLQLGLMETFLRDWPVNAQSGKPELPQFYSVLLKGYNTIVEWSNNLRALAQKKIDVKPTATPGADRQQPSGESRELMLTRQLWNAEANPFGINLILTEGSRLAAQPLSQADQDRLRVEVDKEIAYQFQRDEKFRQSMQAYLVAGNQDGYKRLLHSKYRQIIVEGGAAKRALGALGIKQKGAPAPKPGGAAKPGANGARPPAKPVAGEPQFERIPQHPRLLKPYVPIDLVAMQNHPGWLAQGKAILKGGRHVRWR